MKGESLMAEKPKCVTCEECGKQESLETKRIRNFFKCTNYFGSNKKYENLGVYTICKDCLTDMCFDKNGHFSKQMFLEVLQYKLNKPFLQDIYDNSYDKFKVKNKRSILGDYMGKFALHHSKQLTWEDSKFDEEEIATKEQSSSEINTVEVEKPNIQEVPYNENDLKAKNDCIRMLGYDPFVYESDSSKIQLYNKLVDYLDESTLEDSFKLPMVIQIVKTLNQIDNIDKAISDYTSGDAKSIVENSKDIKVLFSSKKDMLTSILNIAKDNGISINHSNNKSQGAGTLSGIMKRLGELDLEEAEMNLFNIETSQGIEQVAQINSKCIMEQLAFDENDYAEMLKEARSMVESMQKKVDKLEEENRKLKIQLARK